MSDLPRIVFTSFHKNFRVIQKADVVIQKNMRPIWIRGNLQRLFAVEFLKGKNGLGENTWLSVGSNPERTVDLLQQVAFALCFQQNPMETWTGCSRIMLQEKLCHDFRVVQTGSTVFRFEVASTQKDAMNAVRWDRLTTKSHWYGLVLLLLKRLVETDDAKKLATEQEDECNA